MVLMTFKLFGGNQLVAVAKASGMTLTNSMVITVEASATAFWRQISAGQDGEGYVLI